MRVLPGRLGGGARGEFVPFDEDDVPDAGAGQVVGDARADDPAAYDDDLCLTLHGRSFLAASTTAQAAAASWMPRPTLL